MFQDSITMNDVNEMRSKFELLLKDNQNLKTQLKTCFSSADEKLDVILILISS